MSLRNAIKKRTPWPLHYLYLKLYYFPKDAVAAWRLLSRRPAAPDASFAARLRLIGAFYRISYFVDCPHTEHELLSIAQAILDLPPELPGSIVEAGAFRGGSTAKLSLVARLAGRELDVFDSFEGMPENDEEHGKSIYGREHRFRRGSHAAPIENARMNVARYGDISRTHFHKGWFSETMPGFKKQVAAACINVDLVQSTRDCLKYLYPLVPKGGVIFSQDAHFPWVISLLRDDAFWRNEIGIPRPEIPGLGASKFVAIRK